MFCQKIWNKTIRPLRLDIPPPSLNCIARYITLWNKENKGTNFCWLQDPRSWVIQRVIQLRPHLLGDRNTPPPLDWNDQTSSNTPHTSCSSSSSSSSSSIVVLVVVVVLILVGAVTVKQIHLKWQFSIFYLTTDVLSPKYFIVVQTLAGCYVWLDTNRLSS